MTILQKIKCSVGIHKLSNEATPLGAFRTGLVDKKYGNRFGTVFLRRCTLCTGFSLEHRVDIAYSDAKNAKKIEVGND